MKTYVYDKEELSLNKTMTVDIGWIESPDKIYVLKVKQLQSYYYNIYFAHDFVRKRIEFSNFVLFFIIVFLRIFAGCANKYIIENEK